MSELDPNKIITSVAIKKIDDSIEYVKSKLGSAVDVAKAKLALGYGDYVKRAYARCSQIKTILYRHQPVPLRKHYVNQNLEFGKSIISDKDFIGGLDAESKFVIMGTAGTGKSLLMKYICLELVDRSRPFIPLFIELRALNELPALSLRSHIWSEVSRISPAITEEFFILCLKSGVFAILLDGFDEVDIKQAKRVEREIIQLAAAYPKNVLGVSSRNDDRFFAWQDFSIHKVLPMTMEMSIALISAIDYEEAVKNKFIKKIRDELYRTHREFLSNPLLTTIMLLTFEQIADIPEKMHVFYQQAFETLFHRHDATKEMYKRDRYTPYSIDVFQRIFGAFCLITYMKQRFSFDEAAALDFIAQAFELEGLDHTPDVRCHYLQDLMMSVCMLQRDGSDLQFSHRSFQEYFCASYICGCDPSTVGKLLDEIVERAFLDRTLSLIRDMSPEIFDKYWTIPRLKFIVSKIERLQIATDLKSYLSVFYSSLDVHTELPFVTFRGIGKTGRNLFFIRMIYTDVSKMIFSTDLQRKMVDVVTKHKGQLLPAKKISYPIGDCSMEMLRELRALDGSLNESDMLCDLYKDLTDKYDRKTQQMNLLVAKAKA